MLETYLSRESPIQDIPKIRMFQQDETYYMKNILYSTNLSRFSAENVFQLFDSSLRVALLTLEETQTKTMTSTANMSNIANKICVIKFK